MATPLELCAMNHAKRTLVAWRRDLPFPRDLTLGERKLAKIIQQTGSLPNNDPQAAFREPVYRGVNLTTCLLHVMHSDVFRDQHIGAFGSSWISLFVKWNMDPFDLKDPMESSVLLGQRDHGNRDCNFHWYFGIHAQHFPDLARLNDCAMGLRQRKRNPISKICKMDFCAKDLQDFLSTTHIHSVNPLEQTPDVLEETERYHQRQIAVISTLYITNESLGVEESDGELVDC